jgi:hypothetical protein
MEWVLLFFFCLLLLALLAGAFFLLTIVVYLLFALPIMLACDVIMWAGTKWRRWRWSE